MNSTQGDLLKSLKPYLKNWKWLALGSALGILLAVLYLRYTIPKYDAQASIQILEESGSNELSVLDDLNFLSGSQAMIEDEISVLGSRSNFIKLVKRLKLNKLFFVKGNIKDSELYADADKPFSLNYLSTDSIVDNSWSQVYVEVLSKSKFRYKIEEEDEFKDHEFGEKFGTSSGDLILTPNPSLMQYKNQVVFVSMQPIFYVADVLRNGVLLSAADDSNIIDLYTEDPIRQRGIDILNSLIQINNQNAVADKKAIADRTTQFINDRITDIYGDLSSVDETAENFKSSRGIADLGSQSNINFSQSAKGQQQLQNVNIQLNIAQSMQELLVNNENYGFVPSNVGISDAGIANTVQRYNEIVTQRNRLLESSNEKNPVIVKLNQQLDGLRQGMQSSLNNLTNNLDLQANSLSRSLSQINSKIYAAPKNERALRDISRKQQTTESLYLYLLQKREESQITFASATPKSKIIDSAYGSLLPVSPSKPKVFMALLILGLLVPFSVIYLANAMDNKVHNKVELEGILEDKFPVIAELPKLSKRENKLLQGNDRSVLAESLRILRTNLTYLLQRKKASSSKVILVTSSVPGEGKTFVSSNLSVVLSSNAKRVLLVGADIRNPKLYNFYNELQSDGSAKGLKKRTNLIKGLTEYLSNDDVSFNELVTPLKIGEITLDVVYSGKIMPNPTELLMRDRVKEFFEAAKEKYDYIIVDSAPLLVVADTLEIIKYADKVIYVTKAGMTDKKILNYPIKLLNEGKLKNISFIVNGVKTSNLGYGSKYGYGYGVNQSKWWQFKKA